MDHRELDITREFAKADLGDARLDRRLGTVASAMAEEPSRSFPEAMPPSDLEGAYRLFGNGRVEMQKVIEPHQQQTVRRVSELEEVVVAHDTTELRFKGESRRNLGTLGTAGQGFLAHVGLAVMAERGDPLGVLHVETWARTKDSVSKRRKRGEITQVEAQRSKDRESLRWCRGVEAVAERIDGCTSPVHVMDSEADDYGVIFPMVEGNHRFVIRLGYDRAIEAEGPTRYVRELAEETTVVAERQVHVSPRKATVSSGKGKRRKKRAGRTAKLAISATQTSLRRPQKMSSADAPKSVELNVVYAREVDAPDGEDPIEWVLLTTEPIEAPEQLLRIVDYYRRRWVIEEYFKAIKTGCSMESRQLETLESLLIAFGVFVPIAWALLRLRTLSRIPDATAEQVLTPTQVQILTQHARGKLKADEPTARDALLAVARLGGHLKSNGDPGWIVLTRGYTTLMQLEQGYRLAMGMEL